MPIKIKILSLLFLPFFLFAQEDSTVNLLPNFKNGELLTYSLISSVKITEHNQQEIQSQQYKFSAELLKTGYGLSVWKAIYLADSNYIKKGLEVYFTIDSNKRFLAIENSSQVFQQLKSKMLDSLNQKQDTIDIESFFPEISLIYFLNGAKYRMSEQYTSESFMFFQGEIIETQVLVEMVDFDRRINRFRIKVVIQPKIESKEELYSEYLYTFSLNTLRLIELDSKQTYVLSNKKHQKSLSFQLDEK